MQAHTRYPEIDLLRTIAIAGMIVYHTAFDLAFFYEVDLNVFDGLWKLLARSVAILFLLLVGVSFVISWERTTKTKMQDTRNNDDVSWFLPACRTGRFLVSYKKYVTRGLMILACAMAITLVTYVLDPSTYIRFGILHVIGTATFLLPLFARARSFAFVPGLLLILTGQWMQSIHPETPLLIPVGMYPASFTSLDYFPLVPWLGVILIGVSLGHVLYIKNLSWRATVPFDRLPRIFSWPGRHALIIYLVHQPLILGILAVIHLSLLAS